MIKHDSEKNKFFLKFGQDLAFLKYKNLSDNKLEIFQTYVPRKQRGQGVAGKLTQAALEFAKTSGKKVYPSCSYVADFMDRHEEFRSLKIT
jgi:predicted GNAT family acetyltransferase